LQLCVQGRILRSADSGTAIATMKYEFRTARKPLSAEIPLAP